MWVVVKFGGTSVSSRQRWETVARVCRERLAEGLRPLVVCSAVTGVSDALEQVLEAAVKGTHEAAVEAIALRHRQHAADLGVSPDLVGGELAELRRLATGVSLVGEASPRVRARLLSLGELMSTRLGAAFLRAQGLEAGWLDVREVLVSSPERAASERRRFLSATCGHERDPALADALVEPVVVTQGFIARSPAGDTVLLGRGGSDTSASVLAARLGAVRCEIWTDVPGMFTANPRQVPGARLLHELGYDEAQEIATMGAKVLHPRSIPPCRAHDIPIHVRCTAEPDQPGTVLTREGGTGGPRVKAISTRTGLTLVSMETVGMWQQVGFLAEAFAVFREHGLSVDMISTSETSVTVTLDPAANALTAAAVDELLTDLSRLCQARAFGPCASVSLVGRNIRGILHQLGPALELFEEQRVHLVSQAASDLNLTFVVDEEQADRLARELHALLFPPGDLPEAVRIEPWWRRRREELLALARERSPRYVLDAETVRAQVAALEALGAVDRVLYAVKANPHPDLLRLLHGAGVAFDCVSPGEIEAVRAIGVDVDRILFTPNFAPRREYAEALELGVRLTLDDLHPLRAWPELLSGREVFVRIDPGHGRGHHRHVRTAGTASKFGIDPGEVDELLELTRAHRVRVTGLHAHSGSGIKAPETWSETATFLERVARRFPEVVVLDLGGGLGVPEKPGDPGLDLSAVDATLARFRAAHPRYALWLEPGRFLVSPAGVLLATVTQTKRKGEVRYVGVDTGMNSLIRPALYGSWHPIVNLTRLDAPRSTVAHVVGPICETGDTLGYARHLPPTEEGDVLLVGITGAYGRAMSSRYNLREPAEEVLIASPGPS